MSAAVSDKAAAVRGAATMLLALLLVSAPNISAGRTTLPAHMYVATAAGVYRFPIGSGGIPAHQPDLVLRGIPGQPFDPNGMAINDHGDVFLTGGNGNPNASIVYEFAFDASGFSQPIREFSIVGAEFGPIDVDPNGFAYVCDFATNGIDVFEPGVSGKATPLHVIRNWPPGESVIHSSLTLPSTAKDGCSSLVQNRESSCTIIRLGVGNIPTGSCESGYRQDISPVTFRRRSTMKRRRYIAVHFHELSSRGAAISRRCRLTAAEIGSIRRSLLGIAPTGYSGRQSADHTF